MSNTDLLKLLRKGIDEVKDIFACLSATVRDVSSGRPLGRLSMVGSRPLGVPASRLSFAVLSIVPVVSCPLSGSVLAGIVLLPGAGSSIGTASRASAVSRTSTPLSLVPSSSAPTSSRISPTLPTEGCAGNPSVVSVVSPAGVPSPCCSGSGCYSASGPRSRVADTVVPSR